MNPDPIQKICDTLKQIASDLVWIETAGSHPGMVSRTGHYGNQTVVLVRYDDGTGVHYDGTYVDGSSGCVTRLGPAVSQTLFNQVRIP